ncbi:unnamed protein product [Cylicocyclus nassatus]|uniref:SCP domain-containing protein n=1 Tax=Cylicocyclus nassatus TaxID=53992 RepID=A0AA36GZ63_CYLNA|nr:unnamed protein product [Cylicocyclus nassatus]
MQTLFPTTTTMQISTTTKKITTMSYTTTSKCVVTTTPKCVVTTTCRPARNQARAKREATAGNIQKQTFQIPDSQICPNNKEMTDTLRLLFLDMHNYRRLVLSMGKVKREGELLPQAKNMMRLVYDCGLEELAVKYAKRCPLTKSQKPGKVHLGKNYYRVSKVENASLVDAVVTGVDSWWRAGETTHPGPSVLFQKSYLHTPIESFTQMAWATTKYLGCSVADCQSSYVCVCNYSPRGNIVGKSVYQPGRSCTECGSGTTCEAESYFDLLYSIHLNNYAHPKINKKRKSKLGHACSEPRFISVDLGCLLES